MARSDGNSLKKGGAGRKRKPKPLRLVRVEPARDSGIVLVFETGGEEHGWLLEHTTVTEFLALLLRGRMRRGR